MRRFESLNAKVINWIYYYFFVNFIFINFLNFNSFLTKLWKVKLHQRFLFELLKPRRRPLINFYLMSLDAVDELKNQEEEFFAIKPDSYENEEERERKLHHKKKIIPPSSMLVSYKNECVRTKDCFHKDISLFIVNNKKVCALCVMQMSLSMLKMEGRGSRKVWLHIVMHILLKWKWKPLEMPSVT